MTRRPARLRWCSAPRGDDGISILETVLALSLFALAIIGVISSVSAGLDLTGRSNGRQVATEEATKVLEDLRAADYSTLGMVGTTTYDTADPTTPDGESPNNLSLPNAYTPPITPTVGSESIVSGGSGATIHKTTTTVSGFNLKTYTYVTWADGAHTQKRVTAVTIWNKTSHVAGLSRVVLSSIYTADKIDFPTTSTSTSTPSSTSSSTSSTSSTSTTASVCPGDTTGPTSLYFVIAAGSGPDNDYITTATPTLIAAANDACTPAQVSFSLTGTGGWSAWQTVTSSNTNLTGFSVPSGDGPKTIYARFQDGVGNPAGTILQDSAVLDTANPTPAPTGLTATRVVRNNQQDTINLQWNNNTTDANMYGYYIYRRAGSTGSFSSIKTIVLGNGSSGDCRTTASTCSYTDTPGTTTSQTYYIVGVDRAGNVTANSGQASA